uniref:Uncharacterized protein n=1 Tax=Asparagus officinalis TaxID=4686 RepID=Q2XNW1_ASPOF|nr:hypothetical protein 12.t00020 [Asparagus officinalis]
MDLIPKLLDAQVTRPTNEADALDFFWGKDKPDVGEEEFYILSPKPEEEEFYILSPVVKETQSRICTLRIREGKTKSGISTLRIEKIQEGLTKWEFEVTLAIGSDRVIPKNTPYSILLGTFHYMNHPPPASFTKRHYDDNFNQGLDAILESEVSLGGMKNPPMEGFENS